MRNYLFIIFLFNFLFSVILRPENNSQVSYTHVLFEWEQIHNATSYEIQISSDDQFTNTLVSEIVSSLIYIDKENLDWNSTYFWRIRATYNEDSYGEWQSVRSFQILDSITNPSITLHKSFSSCFSRTLKFIKPLSTEILEPFFTLSINPL